jgi:hypothetical protein
MHGMKLLIFQTYIMVRPQRDMAAKKPLSFTARYARQRLDQGGQKMPSSSPQAGDLPPFRCVPRFAIRDHTFAMPLWLDSLFRFAIRDYTFAMPLYLPWSDP